MENTRKILIEMGFTNTKGNAWISDWFGPLIVLDHVTPETLAQFIYKRGLNKSESPHSEAKLLKESEILTDETIDGIYPIERTSTSSRAHQEAKNIGMKAYRNLLKRQLETARPMHDIIEELFGL